MCKTVSPSAMVEYGRVEVRPTRLCTLVVFVSVSLLDVTQQP